MVSEYFTPDWETHTSHNLYIQESNPDMLIISWYADGTRFIDISDPENQDCPFAEVGHGILDWDNIFAVSPDAGVEWYVVEQDRCVRSPLESAKLSLDYLRSRGMI